MFTDIIQPTHLLFILVVALVVLGPKRLPEVGKSLGRGLRDFRSAMSGVEEHTHSLLNPEDHSAEDPIPAATAMHAPDPEAVSVHEHAHATIAPPDAPATPPDMPAVEATAPAAPSPAPHQD